jgi:hypothetical protein
MFYLQFLIRDGPFLGGISLSIRPVVFSNTERGAESSESRSLRFDDLEKLPKASN